MSTGQEPVSGQLGDTSAGEPYDAGNMSGISAEQSNVNKTSTQSHDGSTATSTSNPLSHENAVSSAGRGDRDTALEGAGGVQGSKTGSDSASTSNVAPSNVGDRAPSNAGRASGPDNDSDDIDPTAKARDGPPAQEMRFTAAEIDAAANATSAHNENPHTIGSDGKEENLEEVNREYPSGNSGDQVDEDANKQDKQHGHKAGVGSKIEQIKEKLLHKH